MKKADIAEKLNMSRTTLNRLLELDAPPHYERAKSGSLLDGYEGAIAAMLDKDPNVAATVILERLRPLGYQGGITILKERVRDMRATLKAARSYQRTTYLPGELSQFDWWHTGAMIPVGKNKCRQAMGLVATLPHSAAHATVFSFSRTTADFTAGVLGCFERFGGVTHAAVTDNEGCIVKPRRGGPARLVDDVAALFGHLALRPVVLRPRFPEGKGQDERTVGYLETSFLPLREFDSLADLQHQHDEWAHSVAYQRFHRRVGGRVQDAFDVERTFLRPLPDPLPSVEARLEARVMKDAFVRVLGCDYSVPPGLAGRRVQIAASPRELVVTLEGREIARHTRSYVPCDVVLDPLHAAMLRRSRDSRAQTQTSDVTIAPVDLARYDRAIGVS